MLSEHEIKGKSMLDNHRIAMNLAAYKPQWGENIK
jgi:hypothetical protein